MKLSRFCKCQICGIIILLLSGCGNTKQLSKSASGQFAATPVTIDGDDSEWPNPYPHYDSKAMISYAVSNDRQSLYISVKTGDEMLQHKLLVGGLTVWIDPTGRKQESMAIQYPLKGSGPSFSPNSRHDDAAIPEDARPFTRDSATHHRPALTIPNDISFVGFPECSGATTVDKSNSCGIHVRMNINPYGEMVWEAAVPLATLFKNPSASLAAIGMPVSIGLEVGGMPMPARDAAQGGGGHGGEGMHSDMSANGMSEGGGMGTGGRGGGGMGGHHGGGTGGASGGGEGNEKMELLSRTTQTWIQVSIAAQ